MFIYQHVKAIHEQRFDEYMREKALRPSSHWELRDLLGALAARLEAIGLRDREGHNSPASPAY